MSVLLAPVEWRVGTAVARLGIWAVLFIVVGGSVSLVDSFYLARDRTGAEL
jgi:hypothetical protein